MVLYSYLNNEQLNKKVFDNTAFFSIAEGGAMGEPGAIKVYTTEKKRYKFNYCYGDTDLNLIEKYFPVLGKCEFGLFGLDSKVPEGWNYVNLGAGNHLIVSDKVYKQFKTKTKKLKSPSEFYQGWEEAAIDILGIPRVNLKTENYIFFWQLGQDNEYLSQWYPMEFICEGIKYQNAEQYMMAKKALMFNDITIYNEIMSTSDPEECKKLGKLVRNFDSKKWNDSKEEIVYRANYAKFFSNWNLMDALYETGNCTLAEASPYDKIWGIGLDCNNADSLVEEKWKGSNLLGKALMKVRDDVAFLYGRLNVTDLGVHTTWPQHYDAYYVTENQAEEMDRFLKNIVGATAWADNKMLVRNHDNNGNHPQEGTGFAAPVKGKTLPKGTKVIQLDDGTIELIPPEE